MTKEPDMEPENRTECPVSGGAHDWTWDPEREDWFCELCFTSHEDQELDS